MRISGVAVGQWNHLCRNKESKRRTQYKIYRAIVLGKVSHVYSSMDYIIRYHDLNLLVSHTGIVMTVWRDKSTRLHYVSEYRKQKYSEDIPHNRNKAKAIGKHNRVLRENQKVADQASSDNLMFEILFGSLHDYSVMIMNSLQWAAEDADQTGR